MNKEYFKWVWATIFASAFIWIIWPAPRTNVKLFCSYNRIFIEFEQGNATWGTIMLDDDGKPFPCDDEIRTKTNTNLLRT